MSNFEFSSNSGFSNITNKEEIEPPDRPIGGSARLANNNSKVGQREPLQHLGSFFVDPLSFGRLALPKDINVEIISDIEHCHRLWLELASPKTLFDTWEFRFAFYSAYLYRPYFILLKNQKENLALLPLWYNPDEKRYEWFGSDWQEEVVFLSKDPEYIPILLQVAPSPLLLNAIAPRSAFLLGKTVAFEPDSAKYVLHLEKFSNHEDYLATLKKNERHSMRKDRRRIERQSPEIIIDHFEDYDSLVEISKKRLLEKNKEPDWLDPRRIEAFRRVINLGGRSYQNRMITIKINGKIAGVDLIALFNNAYFTVKCGYNVAEFPGIGNYFNLVEIDDAIKLGFKKIDFLQNNYTWKSRWFEAVPLFKYQKK